MNELVKLLEQYRTQLQVVRRQRDEALSLLEEAVVELRRSQALFDTLYYGYRVN